MKRRFLTATLAAAGLAMLSAAAFAGPTISDKRYWPTPATRDAPHEAYASGSRNFSTNQPSGWGRYIGGPKSGLIAR